jgi:hypothetical protein
MKLYVTFFGILFAISIHAQKKLALPSKPTATKSTVVKKTVKPALPIKTLTKEQQIKIELENTCKRLYTWDILGSTPLYMYYEYELNWYGLDSVFIHPFTDTTTTYKVDLLNINGQNTTRLFFKVDTSIKKVTSMTTEKLQLSCSSCSVKKYEKNSYGDYRWYYTNAQLDSIKIKGYFGNNDNTLILSKGDKGLQLQKMVDNSREKIYTAWLNPKHLGIDSILQYYKKKTTGMATEITSGIRMYYTYDASGKKITSLKKYSLNEKMELTKTYELYDLEYDANAKLIKRKIYWQTVTEDGRLISKAYIAKIGINTINFLGTEEGRIFDLYKESEFPNEVPADFIEGILKNSYNYNEDGSLNQFVSKEESKCGYKIVTKTYSYSPERFVNGDNETVDSKTWCKY